MSKAILKKELQTRTKAQLIDQILELYDAIKPVKEFFTMHLNPDESGSYKKYRKRIVDEFYPATKSFEPKLRFSEAKKAITEFRALKPSSEWVADLMLTLVEMASKFTHDFGDMAEGYYTSTVNNYERALKFIAEHGMLPSFRDRSEQCLKYVAYCGYGFPDEMKEVFNTYYGSGK